MTVCPVAIYFFVLELGVCPSGRENLMKKRNHYMFGAALAGMAVGGVPGLVNRAHAALVTNADFTFETSGVAISTSVTQGASPVGPLVAEIGTGSAYGSHAATGAVFSSPAGNGSTHSFSANDWTGGDYYKFVVPTTGIQNILFSFDQISSSTGPKAFSLFYSTDGTNFSSISNYTLTLTQSETNSNGGTGTESTWTPTATGAYNLSFDLSGVPALNNDANAAFEIVENDTTTATAGTDRVDNVVVSGTAVPEPAELSMLTMAAAGLLFRRRPKKM